MLHIDTHGYSSPDSTTFRVSAAEPELETNDAAMQQVLKLVNGTGTRRSSWGQPGVGSTVVLATEDLVAIHVGFFHKYGGGQFWRYYRLEGAVYTHRQWKDLSDEERLLVLDGYGDAAPSWAKVHGKLRADYRKPVLSTLSGYKLVECVDGSYYSVYDRKTEYVPGKRLVEKALDEHNGGYYSYLDPDGVEQRFLDGILFPLECYERSMELALIECEISGRMIFYGHKIASTYLRPLRELKRFSYTPRLQEAG